MADQNLNGALDTAGKHKPALEPLQIKEEYSDFPNVSGSPTTLTNSNPFDEIIPHPEEVKYRNLVLCFDGTGDQFDADVRANSLPVLRVVHIFPFPELQYC